MARSRFHLLSSISKGTAAVLVLATAPGTVLPLAASEWKPFGLQGTVVHSLAAAPQLLCAGTGGRGVWCRGPGGTATGWSPNGLDGVTVTWLWIDPIDPRQRFAAAGLSPEGPSVYRTLDAGLTWTPLSLPPSGGYEPRAWAVHGVPGSVPVYAAGGEVWVSHDLGSTWFSTSAPGGEDCVEVAPTNPLAVWAGGETVIFSGFTLRSLDAGMTWETVWDSRMIGDNQTSDISAHPTLDGLVLTGHEGFVLRTDDNGEAFREVLAAPSRFFLDWDGENPDRAYAAGSPNGGTAHAFVSGDLGRTWADITGTVLAPRTVFRLEADDERIGVVYAATDDGVFRFHGGGIPVCHDARLGLDAVRLWKGECPPIAGAGEFAARFPAIQGDAIVFEVDRVIDSATHVDLGQVECLAAGGDVALATLDTPDPSRFRALGILSRAAAAEAYGSASSGKPRLASAADCP